MKIQDLQAWNRNKVFHLECIIDDQALIGTDIKAKDLDEAETIMKNVFLEYDFTNTRIICMSEEWIH